MVSRRILYLRQQIIPLVKENTMGTLYAQLTEGERNQIYEFLQEEPSTSGFGGFHPLSHEAPALASPHAWQIWRASHHARLQPRILLPK